MHFNPNHSILPLQGLRYNGMIMTNKLVCRERECQEPRRAMESDRSEFVIVYRRRRVGKTFLVDQYYHGQYDFTFVGGHNLSRQRQLRVLRVHWKSSHWSSPLLPPMA